MNHYPGINKLIFQKFLKIFWIVVTPLNIYVGESGSGPCENECINTAVGCSNSVNTTYQYWMDASAEAYRRGNLLAGAGLAAFATIQQHRGQHACAVAFNDCYENCP